MEFDRTAYLDNVNSAVSYLQSKGINNAEVAVILGSGQNKLVEHLTDLKIIPYTEIPGIPHTTVSFHKGNLILGNIGDRKVMVLQGRFHYYEGFSLQEVSIFVRVAAALGVRFLIATNAAGGLNPEYRQGDLVSISDHINLMGDSPIRGLNDVKIGTLFPDMNFVYNRKIIDIISKAGTKRNIDIHKGIYCGVKGPQMETPAEQKMIRMLGADLVGMSTVPEIITGVQLGLICAGLSIVTNTCSPDNPEVTTVEEVVLNAGLVDDHLAAILVDTIVALES